MNNFKLEDAKREQAKLRIGMSGVSGSGKTYSALLLARGMASSWDKIAVIDTESGSASLYEDLVPSDEKRYKTMRLSAPFSPMRYVEAIEICEKAEMEVIIIDSISHEWNGTGGCLQLHDQYTEADKRKNSYTAWAKVTPMHDKFINAILQCNAHVITSVRRKQEYEMSKDERGKTTVQKLGTKEITREGFEYELTISFEINMDHYAAVSKDRTGIFAEMPSFKITKEIGEQIKKWNESGAKVSEVKREVEAKTEIQNAAPDHLIDKLKKKCPTLKELNEKCNTKFTAWNLILQSEATDCLVKLM